MQLKPPRLASLHFSGRGPDPMLPHCSLAGGGLSQVAVPVCLLPASPSWVLFQIHRRQQDSLACSHCCWAGFQENKREPARPPEARAQSWPQHFLHILSATVSHEAIPESSCGENPQRASSGKAPQERQPGCPEVNPGEALSPTHQGCAEGGSCGPAAFGAFLTGPCWAVNSVASIFPCIPGLLHVLEASWRATEELLHSLPATGATRKPLLRWWKDSSPGDKPGSAAALAEAKHMFPAFIL
ncbi:uncharacterized protein LOC111813948 [Octodon degus]|uniref:Uncharacterized protein LOC111813948 n=1 Tax=Octodon degus TaxID=10160 RepID=A0A6P6DPF6_OCTDE|nr:uncharacterized protein LOC111813948 [Octodon degus]